LLASAKLAKVKPVLVLVGSRRNESVRRNEAVVLVMEGRADNNPLATIVRNGVNMDATPAVAIPHFFFLAAFHNAWMAIEWR
jgi:hypothetical protein